MGKVPLNLAEDASAHARITDAPSLRSNIKQDAHSGGNLNKISGHQGSVHSKIYQTSGAKPTKGSPGPHKKGVGATYSKGAVKTALNIVSK